MQRSITTALLMAALGACGGVDPATPSASSPDADIFTVDAASLIVDMYSPPADVPVARDVLPIVQAPFPAFRPEVPLVVSAGGPVLHAPRIVPVFLSAAGVEHPYESQGVDFLTHYAVSNTWRAQLEEYGVGAGTVAPAVHTTGAGLATGTVTALRLRTWVAQQINSGAWGEPATDSVYVLFLDSGRQVDLTTGSTCRGVGGYHADLLDNARHPVAYAVIPDCGEGIDTITRVLSHEIAEAATDPYPNASPGFNEPSSSAPPQGAWSAAYNGGEIGDLCEQRSDAVTHVSDLDYVVQRTWSNRAASLYADPCVPASTAAVYFNAVPVLPDTVSIMNRSGTRMVDARGIVMAVGDRRTIDVQLFSTGATTGSWSVMAREVTYPGASPVLRFSWDHSYGRNGDVLHLTITAMDDAPDGRVFEVFSSLNRTTTNWVGAVVTK